MNHLKTIEDQKPQAPKVYKPLKFWFCRSPGYPHPFSQNDYPMMEVRKIKLDQVPLNHEFRKEFEELDEDEFWVPISFPKIKEWLHAQRAQLVGNLGLTSTYTVIQNNHELQLECFPFIWTRDLTTNSPWVRHPMKLEINFPDFNSLVKS